MRLDQAPPDHEFEELQRTDWALYWNPDSGPKRPEATQNTTPIKDPKHPNSDSESIDLSTTTPSRPAEEQEQTFHAQSILESHSQSQSRGFAYWPHVLFFFLIFQIGAFAFQFYYFRQNGLPIFKNWPIIWAWAAPANTCIYARSMLYAAPLRWPGLAREEYARWGGYAIDAIWVLWTLGIWLEVRTWGEHGAVGGSGGGV